MNIGSIKRMLQDVDENKEVYFDFCDCVPTEINSWRGVYAQPALGWEPTGYSGNGKALTVRQFMDELNLATSGKEYSGWKGGEYKYNDNSVLHVDNPGSCSHTEIVSIEVDNWRVTLITQKQKPNY